VGSLPTFGVLLMRLAEVRSLDVNALAARATAADAEIISVLDGGEPDPSLLRRLAPALGLHRSDLFIIAGQDVPDDLAARDAAAGIEVGGLSWSLTYLPRSVPQLRRLIQSLPELPGPRTSAAAPARLRYPNSPGGLVLRLLHNRNLTLTGSVKYLYGVGRGPLLSPSTIGMIGKGTKALTPELLAGFAAFLDISSRDLAALTGIEPPDMAPPAHPNAGEVADLIWSARRLTAEQMRQVHKLAHAIRHERASELNRGQRCRCPGPRRDQHTTAGDDG
jgi:hypothetical protein